jgi:hypothetical protein
MDRAEERRTLRVFAALAALALVAAGLLTSVRALWAIAVALALTGLLWPGALRPVWRAWRALGAVLGGAITQTALAAAWYLILTPLALILRWAGRDALDLRPCDPGRSAWRERPPPPPLERYFRPF